MSKEQVMFDLGTERCETQTKQRKRLAGKANPAHPAESQRVELCRRFTVVKAGRGGRKTKNCYSKPNPKRFPHVRG